MRYGHGPKGIIGITLQPSTLKRWALGLHICTQLQKDIKSMIYDNTEANILVHKEESTSRIKTDLIDRLKVREKLAECIHLLDS